MSLVNNSTLYGLNRFRPGKSDLFRPEKYDLVIDGFQRSGNTFLYSLITHYNPDLNISVHRHSSIFLKRAAVHCIPSILTIRNPLDSISSLLVMDSQLGVRPALESYIQFYSNFKKSDNSFVIAPFVELIVNPDKFISELNTKYTLNLSLSGLKGEGLKSFILTKSQRSNSHAHQSAYPNEQKESMKRQLKSKIKSDGKFELARSIYLSLTE